jgi:transcriptional regulator with XRE-family HTH domain
LVEVRVQAERVPTVRDEELRAFLRSRRKRITPTEVGLPQQIGRRLPGLRREDVAELAGMSVGWYARLELGLLDGIAPQTLAAVARALKLDHHETTYLFALTRTPMPPSDDDDDDKEVAKHFRILVERFTAGSAMIISARCDVLASNAIAQNVGFSSAGKGLERNFAWQIFTNPLFRERVVEWDEMARATAGYLRESYAHHVDDPAFEELIEALRSESETFARYWDERVVSPPSAQTMNLRVADGGTVEVARTTTALIDAPGQYLAFLIPVDANDLSRLRAQPISWASSTIVAVPRQARDDSGALAG